MGKIDGVILLVREQADHARLDEFKARQRFRIWKVGEQIKEPKQAWWNVLLHTSCLIFENATPKPVGLHTEWINNELYYTECWLMGISWKATAYEEFQDLINKATKHDAEAWKKLQEVSDIITDYEVPTDKKQQNFYIQVAALHMHEYMKRRLIVDNIEGVAKFIENFERLPKPDEASLTS